jgi:Putative abortive phage resistance protein AbiGi, antitoxin
LTALPKTPSQAAQKLRSTLALEVLAFIKPFNSHLDVRDPSYFYSEREWRKLGSMDATPETVSRVIVARGYLRRARRDLAEYADRIVFAPTRRTYLSPVR